MREAASRGFWVASRVPYGYRKLTVQDGAKKRPTLEPDAATSAVVERIFGMAEVGRGILDITRTLNNEGIANPTGRLWSKNGVHIILRNEAYTGTLAQEVLRGMRESASRGFWIGSRKPYGYNRVMVQDGAKKRPTLELDPDTSPVVERIFDMAQAGKGMLPIAETLNDEGVASPAGKLWSKNTVHFILKN